MSLLPRVPRGCGRALAVVLSGVCASTVVLSQRSGSEAAFDAVLARLRPAAGLPGLSMALFSEGAITRARAYGVAEVASGRPVTTDTPFPAASLTKPVAAALILKLLDERKLDLSMPLNRFVPRISDASVTIEGVLTHTSQGGYQYNGNRFNLLSAPIEQAGRMPLRQAMESHVLRPLAMAHSIPGLDLLDAGPSAEAAAYEPLLNALALPHRLYGAGEIVRTHNGNRTLGAADGLASTPSDYARFVMAFAGGRLTTAQRVEQAWMEKTGVPGLGWFVQRVGGTKVVWHHGLLPDRYSATVVYLPASRRGAVLMANADGLTAPFTLGTNPDITRSAFVCEYLRRFLPQADAPDCVPAMGLLRTWVASREAAARVSVPVPRDILEGYAGTYVTAEGDTFSIAARDTTLFVRLGGPGTEVFPQSTTAFFAKVNDLLLEFATAPDGLLRVNATIRGETFTATRRPAPG